ncbi:hypothetical protein A9235_01955 [Polynucleobacter sp. MWH-Tro8-2-5-gr]|uniref:site-specific integrase n=1 Tax=Polynucleobacter sp. MWH-Tro8-2-5-gr TaxID=1855606 RepID=UPI0008F82A42|nr:site-specific integrase [Polynucleobacter sp. MWH-Tro8-2-5-gr]OIN02474.1 hypothetical protein A9235_01955 [Polynucleobacter sp. MWH-Tro8-2-5-gr]
MNPTANQLLNETLIHIEGAYAPSTIRAYKGNFEKFIKFCESENKQAFPAHPTTVAKFIQVLTKSGIKSASIRLAFASISTIHKLNELPDPTQSPTAKLELRRMHRTLGRTSKQAYGITTPTLRIMLEGTSNDLRGVRNRALLLIAYDSLCRRSELTSLNIEDIEHNEIDSRARIRLRKSKTDQDSLGTWLLISNEAFIALANWLESARIKSGKIFRGISPSGEIRRSIQPAQINRIYKKIAKDAGISQSEFKNISGHSLRVGAAQDLMTSGASLPILMARGRWSKPDTVIHYVKSAN